MDDPRDDATHLDPNDFDAYYRYAPAALALREVVRLAAVRGMDLPEPILDVGCGDGIFAKLAWPEKNIWGIDINPSEVRRAQATASYRTLICGSITSADLPQNYFHSAIANCSLEHVPDIHGAFENVRRSLVPGAPFVLIVPTPDWARSLAGAQLLDTLGAHGLSQQYREALDRLFFHVHLVDEDTWKKYLDRAGFDVVEVKQIASPAVAWAFDVMLYPSLLGWITKKATGRWTLLPGLRGLTSGIARKVIEKVGELAPRQGEFGEYLIVARAK